MKTLTTLTLATLATAAFAGTPVMAPSKNPAPPEPCFMDREFQLDLFASYATADGENGDGWGGGIALNYYLTRNWGFSIDGSLIDADTDTFWHTGVAVLARYPVDLGGVCLAPYLKAGGGVYGNGSTEGFFGGGGGIEVRITPRFGIFGECTYNWTNGDDDFTNARAGFRFVF